MASNEEGNMGSGKAPESAIVLESIQAIEKLKLTKVFVKVFAETEQIRNNHEQRLNELSDRLQSIETSISKLSKFNEDPQKSNDDSMRKTIDGSTVQTNNTTNVASEKRFKLKHVFKNVKKFKEDIQNFSIEEDHYNAKWCIYVIRNNDHLGFYILCIPIDPSNKWSIRTKLEWRVVGRNQNDVVKSGSNCYQKRCGNGFQKFLEWEEMEKWYLVDGNLTVEAKVTVLETAGLGKKKIRKFDESQKDISDVILVVRGTEFYVSKMFLASQSSVFKALLFGKFTESQQSEVTLNGIDPNDFHYFLEILYGESAIDEGVALLADMYDAPTAIRKCEEFLLEKSKKTIGMKLAIATRYHLENMEENCMSDIKNIVSKNSKISKRNPFRKLLRL